jgi:hypothetical protein
MNFAIRFLLFAALVLTSLSAVNADTFTLDDFSITAGGIPAQLLNDEPCIAAAALPFVGVGFAQLGMGPLNIIDGVSDGNDAITGYDDPPDPDDGPIAIPLLTWSIDLLFSVDRQSVGAPGTGVRQE